MFAYMHVMLPSRVFLATCPQVYQMLSQHEVDVLDEAASRQLFRQAAGLGVSLRADLKSVEDAILKACGGLPLALQLMGGQLLDNMDLAVWKVMQLGQCFKYASFFTC
jgi:hypothetical protein